MSLGKSKNQVKNIIDVYFICLSIYQLFYVILLLEITTDIMNNNYPIIYLFYHYRYIYLSLFTLHSSLNPIPNIFLPIFIYINHFK